MANAGGVAKSPRFWKAFWAVAFGAKGPEFVTPNEGIGIDMDPIVIKPEVAAVVTILEGPSSPAEVTAVSMFEAIAKSLPR